jgi:hypothetical protein
MTRGFLAGSSWLLHIKQICIEIRKEKVEIVLKGVHKKGVIHFKPSTGQGNSWLKSFVSVLFSLSGSPFRVKVDSVLPGIAARKLKKITFF